MSLRITLDTGTEVPERLGEIARPSASWRGVGGCWELSFDLALNDESYIGIDPAQWLNKRLDHDTWQWWGVIVQVGQAIGWNRYRWSLINGYANEVATVYKNGLTAFSADSGENDRYGDWQYVEENTDLRQTEAETLRANLLSERANLNPQPAGTNTDYVEVPTLQVRAIGFLPAAARFASGYWRNGSAIGYDAYGEVSTTLTANASEGATTLTVSSISGFSDGDAIVVLLDDYELHHNVINGAPSGSTITLTDKMPSGFADTTVAATSGNLVARATVDIDDFLNGVIGDTDMTAGEVETNDNEVSIQEIRERTAWGRLRHLATVGTAHAYELTVDTNKYAHCVSVGSDSSAPAYYIYRDGIRRKGSGRLVEPYECRPAWYRDTRTQRTFYVEEVSVSEGDTMPRLNYAERRY